MIEAGNDAGTMGRSQAAATCKGAAKRTIRRAKMLRKSSASAVEAMQPGAAMRHLGHRSADLAYRFYIDHAEPLPPALPVLATGKEGAA